MTWLTIKQAAEQLQISPGTVRSMIEAGRLKATVVGSGKVRKTYRIPAESLEQIADIDVPQRHGAEELPRRRASGLNPAIARAMGL